MISKLALPEQRLLKVISRRLRKRFPDIPIYVTSEERSPPQVIEQSADTRRGGPSRLAVQVRRNIDRFKHLKVIAISQQAPPWRRLSKAIDPSPSGLQSILKYDSSSYRVLWYKTATKGHRAKIFVK